MKKLFLGICLFGAIGAFSADTPAYALKFNCPGSARDAMRQFYSSPHSESERIAFAKRQRCTLGANDVSPMSAGPMRQCVVTVGADQSSHKKWNLVGKSAALGTHPVPRGGSITVSAQGQFTLAGGAKISRTHKC